jgi:serine/threonine protein kinase
MSKPSLFARFDLTGKIVNCSGSDFKIGNLVAKGTFCCVYSCAHTTQSAPDCSSSAALPVAIISTLGNIVIKVFKSMRQFRRTVRALSAVDCANCTETNRNCIEHILGVGSMTAFNAQYNTFDMAPYVLLPQFDMRLKDFLKQYVGKYERGLPALATLTVARQLFQALDCLERANVVHGDIKPGNIMIHGQPVFDDSGITHFETVLCDFGSARLSNPETRICAPACVGTESYIAPEVLLGHPYTARADIWSAMVTIFYVMTGDLLFDIRSDNDLDYGIDLSGVMIQTPSSDEESETTGDHPLSMTDDDTSRGAASGLDEMGYDVGAADDIDFSTFYAFVVLMYRLLGKPPEAFCNIASDYYYNGVPRYNLNLIPGTILQFFGTNYHNLNRNAMQSIEEFLLLGLQYMDVDRNSASAILAHKFFGPLQATTDAPAQIASPEQSPFVASTSNDQKKAKRQKKKHITHL